MLKRGWLRLLLGLLLTGGALPVWGQTPAHLAPPEWSWQLGTNGLDQVSGIAASGSDVFIAGHTNGRLATDPHVGGLDVFVARLGGNGTQGWVRQFGSTVNETVTGIAVHDATPAVWVYLVCYTSAALDGIPTQGGTDTFLVKYDAAGNRQWTRQLGTNTGDFGQGVATAPDGSVYVTGYTSASLDGNASAGGQDVFLAKYDAAGNRLWSRLLGSSANEQGRAVAVDANGGVYVTGFTFGGLAGRPNGGGSSSSTSDLFVAKYDSAGNRQWARQLGGSTTDVAQAVATSRRGSGEVEVYVAGRTLGALDGLPSRGSSDLVVVKYDGAGNQQWLRQFGTPGDDQVFGVTSDGGGAVYVAGSVPSDLESGAPLGSNDLVLFKLDSAGTTRARKQLGSVNTSNPTKRSDVALAVAADQGRGVYLAGFTEGNLGSAPVGDKDAVVVKYLEGCEVTAPGQCALGYGWGRKRSQGWARQAGSEADDYAYATVATPAGIYAAGEAYGAFAGREPLGIGDMFLVAYDTAGEVRWVRQHGTPESELVYGLAADDDGSLYVAGGTDGSLDGHPPAGFFDVFLVKYSADGELLWTWQLGSSEFDVARAVVGIPGGGVYVVGSTYGNFDGNVNAGFGESDFFVSKVDASGTWLWTRQFGTEGYDEAEAVTLDAQGNVYVSGSTRGSMGSGGPRGDTDVVLLKLDPEGNVLWSRQVGSSGADYSVGVVQTGAGILVAGGASGSVEGQEWHGGFDLFSVLVSPATGAPLEAWQAGTEQDEFGGALTSDGAGGAWLTGSTLGELGPGLGGQDVVLVRLSSTGHAQGVRQLGTDQDEHAEGITIDAEGRVYMAGGTVGVFEGQTPAGSFDCFVLKADAE